MFGWQEILIILLIIVLIFGAKKLPEIGAGLGKGITNFKDAVKGTPVEDKKDETGQIKKDEPEQIEKDS